jgi:hypothetical protein
MRKVERYMSSATVLTRADVESLDDSALQRLLATTLRVYAGRIIESGSFPPFTTTDPLTATEALLTAGEILRAAEISSFELASMLNI